MYRADHGQAAKHRPSHQRGAPHSEPNFTK